MIAYHYIFFNLYLKFFQIVVFFLLCYYENYFFITLCLDCAYLNTSIFFHIFTWHALYIDHFNLASAARFSLSTDFTFAHHVHTTSGGCETARVAIVATGTRGGTRSRNGGCCSLQWLVLINLVSSPDLVCGDDGKFSWHHLYHALHHKFTTDILLICTVVFL